MKKLVFQIVLIVTVSAVLGFVSNSLNPNKLQVQMQQPQVDAVADSLLEQTAMAEQPVTIDKAQVTKLVAGGAQLVDVRLPEEFDAGHIEAAVNIPYELLADYIEKIDELSRNLWLITYCDGPPCEKSVLMADELQTMGFERVAVYYAGLEDWRSGEDDNE